MADFDTIKTSIDANIKANGKQQITGEVLNSVLKQMVDSVDEQLSEILEENEIQIEDLQNTKIDKEADDYYPQLSVGTADNLTGVDEVARVINFGQSGGGAITDGVARVQSIKGNSVVWNQWSKQEAGVYGESNRRWTRAKSGVTDLIYNNATFRIVVEDTTQQCPMIRSEVYAFPSNHKMFVSYDAYVSANIDGESKVYLGYFSSPTQWLEELPLSSLIGKKTRTNKIVTLTNAAQSLYLGIYASLPVGTILEYSNIKVCDLTQMFGAGNEPNTIEDFYARIPMGVDLYEYNNGEVISMKATGIKSVGRNAFDGNWEQGDISGTTGAEYGSTSNIRTGYIAVIPNLSYYISTQGKTRQFIRARLYDADKNFVGITSASGADIYTNEVFTIPSNAHYIRFAPSTSVIAQSDFLCLNISDTDFNGQYEPYIEDSEDLSIVRKYFPNGMRSAGSAHDEIRYNKATNKWEKVVRIGEVDLGTIGYSRGKYGDIYAFSCQIPQADKMVGLTNMVCGIYSAKAVGAAALNNMEMRGDDRVAYPNSLYIRNDAYTDTASFKAAMSGVMLYYELAEPIVTEIEDKNFNLDYKVWNCGTEQMEATEPSSALSADITYGFNAVGLIKQLRSLVEAMQAKLASL